MATTTYPNIGEFPEIGGPSGFIGYGDLWGFILHGLFILNPCLGVWGFMGIYITRDLSINPHKSPGIMEILYHPRAFHKSP